MDCTLGPWPAQVALEPAIIQLPGNLVFSVARPNKLLIDPLDCRDLLRWSWYQLDTVSLDILVLA
ncbi:hypothetical protein D9M71_700790 [compost metagenome]